MRFVASFFVASVATVIVSATVDLGSLQGMVEESRMMTLCLNSKDSISSREASVCPLFLSSLSFCFVFLSIFLGGGFVWGKNMKNLLLSIGDNQGDNLILV